MNYSKKDLKKFHKVKIMIKKKLIKNAKKIDKFLINYLSKQNKSLLIFLSVISLLALVMLTLFTFSDASADNWLKALRFVLVLGAPLVSHLVLPLAEIFILSRASLNKIMSIFSSFIGS